MRFFRITCHLHKAIRSSVAIGPQVEEEISIMHVNVLDITSNRLAILRSAGD